MPVPRDDAKLIDWLDAEAEAFSSASSLEHYLNSSGQKDELSLVPIYERHRDLFARKTVERVLATAAGDERLPNLREFVVDGFLDEAAKELSEAVAARETGDTVSWDGEQVPYRSLSVRVMNDPDAARRRELDQRRLIVTSAQNELRLARWKVLYEQTHELNYTNYASMCDELGSLKLDELRDMMGQFLSETEKSYRRRLDDYLRAIDVEPAYAERCDLARLFREPKFDGAFPRQKMLASLNATLRGLGIDPDRQPNVHVDADERPKKSPRAFCAAARIPEEIYLVISPHGGHDDYRALFHEAGHAEHFAHVAADMPFAFRGQGDNSVTEGFAFLLEHLLYSPQWLQCHLGLDDATEYLAFASFHKLWFLRRYSAKLLYELELHRSEDVASMGKRYADILTAHIGVRHSPEDYLADLDDGFYCARYLRAWTFDAQVRAWFERTWGGEWFADSGAGAALRELWSHGQRYDAEALLTRIGEEQLDIAPLMAEVMYVGSTARRSGRRRTEV